MITAICDIDHNCITDRNCVINHNFVVLFQRDITTSEDGWRQYLKLDPSWLQYLLPTLPSKYSSNPDRVNKRASKTSKAANF